MTGHRSFIPELTVILRVGGVGCVAETRAAATGKRQSGVGGGLLHSRPGVRMLLERRSELTVAAVLVLVSTLVLVVWWFPRGEEAAARGVVAAPAVRPPTATGAQPRRRLEGVTRGTTRATLSYRRLGLATVEARLRIFLSGRLLVDDRMLPFCSYCAVVPKGMWGGSSLSIQDLDRDGDLEVLVELGKGMP